MTLSEATIDRVKMELRERAFAGEGVTIGVFLYDHRDDAAFYQLYDVSDRQLARENDPTLTNTILEKAIRVVLSKWRGGP